MQGLKMKDIPRRNKNSVASLLESAGTMLKNGVSPDVIDFARLTLAEIEDTVVPAINDASREDQLLVNLHYALFETALSELQDGNEQIRILNAEQKALSTQHKACRQHEEARCTEKQECDYELYEFWERFSREETDLRSIQVGIDGHFCHGANGTLASYRAESIPYMTSFITQWPEVILAEEHYDDWRPVCVSRFTVLDDKTEECDAIQLSLEQKTCEHAVAVRTVRTEFSCAWHYAVQIYTETVTSVRIQEVDRINEFRSLENVKCLLDRISSRNGVQCGDVTEVEAEFAVCETQRTTVDVTVYKLEYHDTVWSECTEGPLSTLNGGLDLSTQVSRGTNSTGGGDCEILQRLTILFPADCPRCNPEDHACYVNHNVVGRCYPEVPHYPCSAAYTSQEYNELPDVPMPVFTETNSHCNPRPSCVACTPMSTPTAECSISGPIAPPTTASPPVVTPPATCPQGWVQVGESGADIGGCGLQECNERYGTTSEVECSSACDAMDECQSFTYSPALGDRNHEDTTVCTLYNADAATGTWSGTAGFVQVLCTRAAPVCGALPVLTNAVWTTGLQYRCAEGFSGDGFEAMDNEFFDTECLGDGLYTMVHACVPIDDCSGHTCGAFGTCDDLHMDYTCTCADGFVIQEVEGEKICGNVDDCNGHQCGNGGVCEDLVSDYNCICNDGWHQEVSDEAKTCERSECGVPPTVTNLMFANGESGERIFPWTRGKAVFEERVDYECAMGYSTDGEIGGMRSFSIMCLATGEFTAVQQCLPISCGEPQPSGAANPASSDAVSFGESVEFHCPLGHGPEVFTRGCLATGQFSPSIACEPYLCDGVVAFDAAELTSEATMYFFGDTAHYVCEEGYSTNPADRLALDFALECGVTGWATVGVSCHPITCEFHLDDTHSPAGLVGTTEFGGTSIIRCADGYTTDGSAGGATEIFGSGCNLNGDAEIPSCRPVTCAASDLPASLSGHSQLPASPPAHIALGARATYTCDHGYAVANTAASSFEVECLRTGEFSALSTCWNIDDCAGHSCGSNGHCVDEIGDYSCQCEDGFEETEESGEKMCGNIDDCGPSLCGSFGACHDGVEGYVCECAEGYEVSSGGDDRICEPKTCQFPTLVGIKTELVPTQLLFSQHLILECVEGHSVSGANVNSFEIECTADASLTPVAGQGRLGARTSSTGLPECTPVVCGHLPPVPHAVSSPSGDYFFGDVARYACQGDSVEITYQCNADGQFQLKADSLFTRCDNPCGSPTVPLHAHRVLNTGPLSHPAAATYDCDEGYTHLSSGLPSGQLSQQCNANGVFETLSSEVARDTEGRATCVPVLCERPTVSPNWEYVDTTLNFNTQTPVDTRCADGYELPTSSGASEYIGCFIDDGNRDLNVMRGSSFTFTSCREECGSNSFMSLQYGGECFCANSYGAQSSVDGPYRQVDDSECGVNGQQSSPALGHSSACRAGSHSCGGIWRQAIYRIARAVTCNSDGGHSSLPDACVERTYTLSGRIRSALPPLGYIGGASLVIAGQTVGSGSNGDFTANVPAGTHDFTVTANGFITSSGSVTITGNTAAYHLHMSPLLDADSWRIVLSWQENPRDLDSHLIFHGESESWYGCPQMYYGRTRASCGGVTASLDVDDTSSFGPETTTLTNVNSCSTLTRHCRWVYKVKNWSRSPGWLESEATVKLYNGDHEVGTYNVNGNDGYTNGDGNGSEQYWSIFAIDHEGTVQTCTDAACN